MADPQIRTEDERGVDVAQLRRQLELTIPERVRTMVAAANALMAIQRHASSDSSLRCR
jgi:hypothetical protein